MNADPRNFQIPYSGGLGVKSARTADWHSELVFMQTRGNVGMGIGRHVRIHAESHAGNRAQPRRALCQSPEFRLAFHIEQQNPSSQRRSHLVTRLSHAREYDLLGRAAVGGHHPLQFSARNYVKAASLPRQQAQNAHIGIRLDGIADGVGDIAKRVLKGRQPLADRRCRIDVERRSVALRQFWQRKSLAVKHEIRATAQQPFPVLVKNESRRPLGINVERSRNFAAPGHFRLGEPDAALSLTLIATTVWSSNVSTPAECSATALKRESTTQSADRPAHSAMIFSTRPRPNSSPFRLRASRMPSLKNTNMSPGFILNRNSS